MSEVLSPTDITELRSAVSALFPDRASIFHRTAGGSDTYGGDVPSYPGVADVLNVPILYGTRTAAELVRVASQDVVIDQVFTFPGGTDIRQTDRFVVNGETWEVVNVGGGGAWEVTKTVGAKRTG